MSKATNKQKKRKLSIPRLLLLLLIIGSSGILFSFRTKVIAKFEKSEHEPWYAAYVDATVTPQYDFEKFDENVVLSFIVASNDDQSEPSWGGYYTMEQAGISLELDRKIARLRQKGGDVIVSFGGLLNDEIALRYKNEPEELAKMYEKVVERYDLNTIDLDLENEGLLDRTAGKTRAEAIQLLQEKRREAGKELAVWVTLPVVYNGLTAEGTDAVQEILAAGVDLAGVNLMTMNFGASRNTNQSMAKNAINSLKKTHGQLRILYERQEIFLSDAVLWSKLGATPMIGQNDVGDEVFTLEDARELNEFAQEIQLGRMSLWSANRDRKSNPDYINTGSVSDYYSGVEQKDQEFGTILSEGLNGAIVENAKIETASDVSEEELKKEDDPETSPYEIWNKDKTYIANTKVVWRRNVYQSKWWTKGDAPDSPILQIEDAPWELIGPVLPGEKPIPQIYLPKGTYPEWKKGEVYIEGDRVMVGDNTYEAKWWTENENPQAAALDDPGFPWRVVTQEEVREILEEEKRQEAE